MRSYSSQKVKWVEERFLFNWFWFEIDVDENFGLTDNNDGGEEDERSKFDCFTDIGERGATSFI